MANNDDARELVKRLVRERLVEKAGVPNIVYHGEEISVTTGADGLKHYNLPRLKKSYVVMSGRVYEREYVDDHSGVVDVTDPMPTIVTQLNYKGESEKVDTAVFRNKLICTCGGIRYVKNADLFQVTKCKPCTIKDRNSRRHKKGA
jgi:hypothetical protein